MKDDKLEIKPLPEGASKWTGFAATYDDPILASMGIPTKIFTCPDKVDDKIIEIDTTKLDQEDLRKWRNW